MTVPVNIVPIKTSSIAYTNKTVHSATGLTIQTVTLLNGKYERYDNDVAYLQFSTKNFDTLLILNMTYPMKL